MNIHRFVVAEKGIRLYPTPLPGIFYFVRFQDITGCSILDSPRTGAFTCQLDRHSRQPLKVLINSAELSHRFISTLAELVTPKILSDHAPFHPEKISKNALELLHSKGQNIKKCFDFLIRQAINHVASDIMFETSGEVFVVSFKTDGLITPIFSTERDTGKRLLNCLKTSAGLLIYRADTIQEGRLTVDGSDKRQDLRVSIIPTGGAERAVIRLFDRLKHNATLDDLEITPGPRHAFRNAISAPGGLVVICGPSGSGKTTTAYAALRELKKSRGRMGGIITVEDPIEYKLEDISQIEVDPLGGVNFPDAIRSVLRQDPSVIMIGEIRDAETADAAITAALTGHLVLATLHAASASEAIVRLFDLGVRPALLGTVLKGVLAQRLIRTLCKSCVVSTSSTDEPFIKGQGCDCCHNSGYQGRNCIAEFLSPTEKLLKLINTSAASYNIEEFAHSGAVVPMSSVARDGVKLGHYDISEVRRVVEC